MRYVSKITFGEDLVYRFDISLEDWAKLFPDDNIDKTNQLYRCVIEITNTDDNSREFFRFSDYRDFETCYEQFNKLVESDIIGLEELDCIDTAVYATPKRALALRSCIEFIEDTDDIPSELLGFGDYYLSDLTEGYPSFKRVTQNGNILFTTGCDYDTSVVSSNKYDDIALPESLILNFLKDFGLSSQKSIDVTIERATEIFELDKQYLKKLKHNIKTRPLVNIETYRYHTDALFQCMCSPLYIDKDGIIYLGYTDDDDFIIGVLKYRITDLKKFKNLVSKVVMLNAKEPESGWTHLGEALIYSCKVFWGSYYF